MLNLFREKKTQQIVLGAILFLVCAAMVITLIPGLGGDEGDTINNPSVAEVAGERITEFDVQQSLQQVSQRNKIPSEMMPFYTSQILNEMILEKASLKEANRLGLQVDESELIAQLHQDPNLFPNGNFVGQEQYENMISDRFGMTVAQFEQRYRDALLLQKLRDLVTDSVNVSPAEVHAAFIQENEKIVLDYVALPPSDFKKDVQVTDAALEQYYKTNKARYQVPEKRAAQIILISKAKVREAVAPSEAELKKYYEDHKEAYRTPERVQVSHILIKADPKNPEQIAAAKKKADDLLKKLKGGADFATLAKQNSDDKTTAVNGGSLGWIVRKQTVPEFENAAFSMKPGTLSDLVQTVYGIHILKVTAHEQPHLQTFDEVKGTIQASLSDEKALQALSTNANEAVAALVQPNSDINAVAAKFHGEVITPAPFTSNESLPRIGASDQFMQEVFGLQKNQVGEPVAIPEGYVIPRLTDIIPPHQGQFEEVKEQVRAEYIDDEAKAKAADKAKALAKALDEQKDQKDIAKAAKSLGLTVKTTPPTARDGAIPSVGSVKDLDPKTFDMSIGATAGPVSVQGTPVVYQIKSREAPKEEDFAAKKGEIEQKLLNQKREVAYDVFQDSLKAKLIAAGDLKLHQDVLARITSQNSKP